MVPYVPMYLILLFQQLLNNSKPFEKSGTYSVLSCSWHQFTNLFSPIDEYFFNEISCYDYSNDTVICILMNPSRFRKCWMISIQKNNKVINISIKKNGDWWIGELMSRIRYSFPKFKEVKASRKSFSKITFKIQNQWYLIISVRKRKKNNTHEFDIG